MVKAPYIQPSSDLARTLHNSYTIPLEEVLPWLMWCMGLMLHHLQRLNGTSKSPSPTSQITCWRIFFGLHFYDLCSELEQCRLVLKRGFGGVNIRVCSSTTCIFASLQLQGRSVSCPIIWPPQPGDSGACQKPPPHPHAAVLNSVYPAVLIAFRPLGPWRRV